MANGITAEQLQVTCRFSILSIQKCRIYAKYGAHTSAEIIGTVNSSEAKAVLTDVTNEKLNIISSSADGVKEILFTGIIAGIKLKEEGRFATLSLKAFSCTWKMDIERKTRSFQCLSKTYREVTKKILQDYNAEMRWNIPDKCLEHPFIQYNETDYHFIKRILSHLGAGVVSGDSLSKISFDAGIKSWSDKEKIDLNKYVYSLIPYCCEKKLNLEWNKRQNGYKISDMNFTRVGDAFHIQGASYYAMEVETVLTHSILKYVCKVFPKECFEVDRIDADNLRGAVLTGEILETAQETIKMKLDIDKEQVLEEAYSFPWRPITGNFLYCMPEVGTRAALYFAEEEATAAIIYSIRENGAKCNELADCSSRYFTTKENKRMYLKSSEMGLLNLEEKNAEVTLSDGDILNIASNNKISVLGEGCVELKGKTVIFEAQKEVTAVRKDVISPTVINLCNAFDMIGKMGNFTPLLQDKTIKKKKKGRSFKQEEYSLDGAVSSILSNMPADGGDDPVLGRVAAAIPVISKQ